MLLNTPNIVEARNRWSKARRAAFWATLREKMNDSRGNIPRPDTNNIRLLDFNEVSRTLKLRNAVYRGSMQIPIDRIVGSMGRYQDFTRTFLPMRDNLGSRWKRVAAAWTEPDGPGMPPIDVYKVGEFFFIRDGNHRTSVARQMGLKFIEAFVWEYTDALPAHEPGANIEKLLVEAERREFLDQTQLDQLRPDHDVRVSFPGGYTELLVQIANYQHVIAQIDGVECPYPEAVTAWYDMIFEAGMQLIREARVSELFPGATDTDFFVWMICHREILEKGQAQAMRADEMARHYGRIGLGKRIARFFRRLGRLVKAIYQSSKDS